MQHELISLNKNIYNVIAPLYEGQHHEIFNQTEQNRIRKELGWALSQIVCSNSQPLTLDFGSGTGNVTRHLLHLGVHVVAADISEACLRHLAGSIGGNSRLRTLL
jgi:2-polyprenyl-3-methyl-5-hydroxy-6-metoxy-1,4-benzoquinol methylase